MSRVLITLYDVVIVIPLMVEHLAKSGMSMRRPRRTRTIPRIP